MKFHIIVAAYNMSSLVEKSIESIKNQTFENFSCLVIDDCSEDNTASCINNAIGDDSRFKIVVNTERKYKVRNVYEGIKMLGADKQDVVVIVDGDDMLANPGVLELVFEFYQKHDCWMTYGSYQNHIGVKSDICQPYHPAVIKNNSYRKKKWFAAHLRTYKFWLLEKIDKSAFSLTAKEYRWAVNHALLTCKLRAWYNWRNVLRGELLDPSGEFIRRLEDKAFTFPLLEMAGEKAMLIEDVLYVYNTSNLDSSPSMYGRHDKKWPGRLIRAILKNKQPYKRIFTV